MRIIFPIFIFAIAFSLRGMNQKNDYLVTQFGLSPAQAKKIKKTAQAMLQSIDKQIALEKKKKTDELVKLMRSWEDKFHNGSESERTEALKKIAKVQKEIAAIESSVI